MCNPVVLICVTESYEMFSRDLVPFLARTTLLVVGPALGHIPYTGPRRYPDYSFRPAFMFSPIKKDLTALLKNKYW
jgi:hypothetical protein